MERRRGSSQCHAARSSCHNCCIRARSMLSVVVLLVTLLMSGVLSVAVALMDDGRTPAGRQLEAAADGAVALVVGPDAFALPHQERRLDEEFTDDPMMATDEFDDENDEFGDGNEELGDWNDELGDENDEEGSGNDEEGGGDQGSVGEQQVGGQSNETVAGDVNGNTTDAGGESTPAESPAAQPSPDASGGDEGAPSAPSADQPPAPSVGQPPSAPSAGDQPSPAKAPASDTPEPTRRPSHTAHTPEAPVPAPAPYAAPQDGAPSTATTDDQVEDKWKDQSYADMAKAEYDSMVHDRNVIIVACVFGVLGFIVLLITAQQMIENPDGCCAKVCRCSIAFWRVVCWPCRKVCGCAKPNKRRGHAVIAGADNDYGGYSHDLELT